jgi:hypothetical protein
VHIQTQKLANTEHQLSFLEIGYVFKKSFEVDDSDESGTESSDDD